MRPGFNQRPSSFAAIQAAQRMHYHRPTIVVGDLSVAALTAETVQRLVEPLDLDVRQRLETVGQEMASAIDQRLSIEAQIEQLRADFGGRLNELSQTLDAVHDRVVETFESLTDAESAQDGDEDFANLKNQPEAENRDRAVAVTLLTIYCLGSAVGIADPKLSVPIQYLLGLLVFLFAGRDQF